MAKKDAQAAQLPCGVSSEETPHQCDGDGSRGGARILFIHSQARLGPRERSKLRWTMTGEGVFGEKGTDSASRSRDRRQCRPDLGDRAVPCGLVAIRIARLFETWGDTPKPSPAQLTALRHLQGDLGPVLASIDVIPSQTDDPALIQAAERVHDALRELLAEMAVVIYRARRRSSGEVSNSIPLQSGGSR
jgi:hypothetical protein